MTDVSTPVWLVSGYAAFLVVIAPSSTGLRAGSRDIPRPGGPGRSPTTATTTPGSAPKSNGCGRCRSTRTCAPRSTAATRSSATAAPSKVRAPTRTAAGKSFARWTPWPHSEAGRFHRGIACSLVLLALLLPLATLVTRSHPLDAIVLVAVLVLVALTGLPLVSHLRHTPSGFPSRTPAAQVPTPAGRQQRRNPHTPRPVHDQVEQFRTPGQVRAVIWVVIVVVVILAVAAWVLVARLATCAEGVRAWGSLPARPAALPDQPGRRIGAREWTK